MAPTTEYFHQNEQQDGRIEDDHSMQLVFLVSEVIQLRERTGHALPPAATNGAERGHGLAQAVLRQHIEAMNPGITGLGVRFSNGVVFLSGQAASAEAMEKAVLLAGNVQGVSDVNIDGLRLPPAPVKEKVEYYIIKNGDTLSAIAKQYYGKANDYPRIFEANREVIKDANLIFPGQKIRIPLD